MIDSPGTANTYVAVGFDGFIDTLVKPVHNIQNGVKQHFSTMDEFGHYLAGKASRSCSVDLDRHSEKPGGNSALFAAALSALGMHSRCIGAYGHPQLHPAFATIGGKTHFEGIANPGTCTALEFQDGKIMLSYNGDLDSLNYQTLLQHIGEERLAQWFQNASAAALFNWSEVPASSSMWRQLQQLFKQHNFTPASWLMLDISDCSRRSAEDIYEMKELMRGFSRFYRVAFSLNTNEADILCRTLGHPVQDMGAAATYLQQELGVELLTVHTLDGAFYAGANTTGSITGYQVEHPAITTGGGDNFNSGLLYALMQGYDIRRCVEIASTVGMLYVKNGYSPSWNQVTTHLNIAT